jgi:hypothetical protein
MAQTASRILSGDASATGRTKRHREPAADRHWRVADAAYYLSEKRGFAPGRELDDWFAAEALIVE